VGGCGGPTGDVSGKVTYKGHTVTGGEVLFLSEKGQLLRSPIDEEGNYHIRAVPAGSVKIAVMPPQGGGMPSPKMRGGQPPGGRQVGGLPKEGGPPPEIREQFGKGQATDPALKDFPAKYRTPEESGLTYTATTGTQTYPIELK
jgi:hypothetical protein